MPYPGLKRELLEWTLREYRMEGVAHFAGYAYVGESIREPSKYFTNNVVNTLNLLEMIRPFSLTIALGGSHGLPF